MVGVISALALIISVWLPAAERLGISVSFMDVPELAA